MLTKQGSDDILTIGDYYEISYDGRTLHRVRH
jgi:hypothetical protein